MGSMAMEDAMPVFEWDHLAEGEQMIRYDARGHGRSEASENLGDYSWPNLARDMLALADELQLEHFLAGGASRWAAPPRSPPPWTRRTASRPWCW
ncbi:MAG TPA: hypothetical protein VGP82_09535 [Ktedonobacterales bacterium]|jgi:pimeloyl-ACP methyl ester carboxylesterase|nr:hypothetical protein [Ktedonobacterales bacterium]